MGRCDTCKHWEPGDDWTEKAAGMRVCGAIQMREEVERSAHKGFSDDDRWGEGWDVAEAREHAALRAAKAVAVDGSSYHAAVMTTADFGCVLHAPTTGEG